MGSSIEWIKISTRIFENRKIKFILSNKKGDKFFKIWVQLLTLAGKINDSGKIYISSNVPYNSDSLAVELGEAAKVVSEALKLFETLEMIRVLDTSIVIDGWEEHQNIEGMERIREQTRNRVKKFREKQNVTQQCNVTESECNVTVTQQNKNKNKKENIDTNNYSHHHNNIVSIERDNCNGCNGDDGGFGNKNNVFALWEHCGFGTISSYMRDKLLALIEETSEESVCQAIEEGARYNGRSLAYVETVARNIASGNNVKQQTNGDGFSGFGAIFERLKKEDDENGEQENCL